MPTQPSITISVADDARLAQLSSETQVNASTIVSRAIDSLLNENKEKIDISRDSLKSMHDIAGKYHLHYSSVRTTATSLVLPIGILTSITMLTNCHGGIRTPMRLLVFVIVSTLFLNALFAKWSRACRHIERYYEGMMSSDDMFEPQSHGFRHLFRLVIRKKGFWYPIWKKDKKEAFLREIPDNLRPLFFWNPKVWLDPFVYAILILGLVYLYIYDQMYRYACGH
jgi:hypothetical protein